MQKSVNITEPDSGLLLESMLFGEGQDIPVERFIEPRVEVELAFILSRRLAGPYVTIFDVLNATEYVVPALEIIDARIMRTQPNGRTRTVLDTIADNAANAGIIIGGRPVRPDALDLRWVSAILYRKRRRRGIWGRGRSAQSSCQWPRLAGQAPPFDRRCAGSRSNHPRRIVHILCPCAQRRHLSRGLWPSGQHRGEICMNLFKQSILATRPQIGF